MTLFRSLRAAFGASAMAIIHAQLENERHAVITRTDNLYVLERVFLEALKSGDDFPWIRQIDPYGDTILNALQIPSFLDEWNRLEAFVSNDAEASALDQVRELADECLREPHRYVRFYGD